MAMPSGWIVAMVSFPACGDGVASRSASTGVSLRRPIIGWTTGAALLCAIHPVGQGLPFRVVL